MMLLVVVTCFLIVAGVCAQSGDVELDEIAISGHVKLDGTDLKEYIDHRIEEDISKYFEGSCDEEWIAGPGHCYYFSKEKEEWTSAQSKCGSMGGILAEPRSKEEVDFLSEQAKTESRDFWIGGTDQHNKVSFVWDSNRDPITIVDWHDEQPNNLCDEQLCIGIRSNNDRYKWNAENCRVSDTYICQQTKMDEYTLVN